MGHTLDSCQHVALAAMVLACCISSPCVANKNHRESGENGGGVLEACGVGMDDKRRSSLAVRHLRYAAGLQGEAAISHLSMAIVCANGRMPEANYRRGIILDATGKRESAMGDLQAACQSAPEEAPYGIDACMTLGVWSSQNGDVRLSHHAFSMAISRDLLSERAWSNYGVLSQQLGRFAEAQRCYRTAAALNPAYAVNFFNLGKVCCNAHARCRPLILQFLLLQLVRATQGTCTFELAHALARGNAANTLVFVSYLHANPLSTSFSVSHSGSARHWACARRDRVL